MTSQTSANWSAQASKILFVSHRCQFTDPVEEGAEEPPKPAVVATAWHSKFPQLAVATADGQVNVFLDEGERQDVSLKREAVASALSWHPLEKVLVAGWSDGKISVWNEAEKKITEPSSSVHEGNFTFIKWTEAGERMILGDEKGTVSVWFFGKGSVGYICKYQKEGVPHTQLIFRTKGRGPAREVNFYFGGEKGNLYAADDGGICRKSFSLGEFASVLAMYYWKERDSIIVITKTSFLFKFGFSPEDKIEQQKKVKVSAQADGSIVDTFLRTQWIGNGLVLTATNENLFRLWNLNTDESHSIRLPSESDTVTAIAYNPLKQSVAVATTEGKIYFWQIIHDEVESQSSVKLLPNVAEVEKGPSNLEWGPSPTLLSVQIDTSVILFNETVLQQKMYSNIAAIQVAPDKVYIERPKVDPFLLQTGITVKQLAMHGDYVAMSNGKKIEVYEVKDGSKFHIVSSFKGGGVAIGLHTETVFVALPLRVEMCNFAGTCKQTLVFSETEGDPILIHTQGNFIVVITNKNFLKCWDLSRREARQHGTGHKFEETGPKGIGRISMAKINGKGSHVSVLTTIAGKGGVRNPGTCLYSYDVERDIVVMRDFTPNTPCNISWDNVEARLLVMEAITPETGQPRPIEVAKQPAEAPDGETPPPAVEDPVLAEVSGPVSTLIGTQAYALLISSEIDQIVVQDSFAVPPNCQSLQGSHVPFFYMLSYRVPTEDDPKARLMELKVMRDFVGLENTDDNTREAMLNFSFHLSVGNMDEAFKAVRLIQMPNVWESMALMCIKTGRADVAELCLANMNNARGIRALRDARKEPEQAARLAVVAIELGLLDEAEKMFVTCGRFDKLNELYQARGEWQKALQCAQKQDRIHLRTTHHLYAKYLESLGDINGAIAQFEQSETHRWEVPRMLFQREKFEQLEKYIESKKDKKLTEWWARYCESQGDFEGALDYYSAAEDWLSIVRVHTYQGHLEEAREVAVKNQDAAASYHLARHYEGEEDIKEAIQFYSRARCFNHGIRLAMDGDMDAEVFSLAIQASQRLMVEAARYFEEKQQWEKAVMLYHKGGSIARAIEICFASQMYNQLGSITDDLPEDTDPKLLTRCIDFFKSRQQYDKVVNLLITGRRIKEALENAFVNKVLITEEMAERLTPPAPAGNEDDPTRIAVLKAIAKVCQKQGSYHLATKKYAQAKDKAKAMKSLLRSADVEKIIFFANVSRQKELFLMAANFLQSLDWRTHPEIMRHIIDMYRKAKSPESLSLFYEACAAAEIDEFKNYEKALGALKESAKYMTAAKVPTKDSKLRELQKKLTYIESFVDARRLLAEDPEQGLGVCQRLLEVPESEEVVRKGDVYSLLVEFYYSQQNYEAALAVIERMRQKKIKIYFFIQKPVVQYIYKVMNQKFDDDDDVPEGGDED